MLSDNEINCAAEAVVCAYLERLFRNTDPACPNVSSQQGDVCQDAAAVYEIVEKATPIFHKPKKASAEEQINVLRREAQVLYVLSCVIGMVQNGLTCTERDMYYRNTLLFPNGQRDTHSSIERLCRWMDSVHPLTSPAVPRGTDGPGNAVCRYYTREGMHIGASGKSILIGYISFSIPKCSTMSFDAAHVTQHGLEDLLPSREPATRVAGSLANSVEVDAMRHTFGVLVNMAMGLHGCRFRGAGGAGTLPSALIIVEKESTLRTLVESEGVWGVGAPLARCVFLCSKGYPCRASRLLLQSLHRELPQLPIYALVDGDPHGMRIALTFMGIFGGDPSSRPRRRQGGPQRCMQVEEFSALLPVRWIGVRPSSLPHDATGLAPLTLSDRRVLTQVMQWVVHTMSFVAGGAVDATRPAEDVEVIRHSLSDMLCEVEWMEKKLLKCALQAWPEGPLHLLSASL